MLIITIAAAGLPVAVSKFVAEQHALGRPEEGKRIIRLSSILLGSIGLILAILMYIGAPLIGHLIGNGHVIPSIRALRLHCYLSR